MGVGQKTTGTLIDELITTSMRCWFAQDNLMDESLSEEDQLQAAKDAQVHNARRSAIIRELDNRIGDPQYSATTKSYE